MAEVAEFADLGVLPFIVFLQLLLTFEKKKHDLTDRVFKVVPAETVATTIKKMSTLKGGVCFLSWWRVVCVCVVVGWRGVCGLIFGSVVLGRRGVCVCFSWGRGVCVLFLGGVVCLLFLGGVVCVLFLGGVVCVVCVCLKLDQRKWNSIQLNLVKFNYIELF